MTSASSQVVLLTPPGRGAVATVLVTGEYAAQQVEQYFHSAAGKPLRDFAIGRVVFGRWHATASGEAEELVVCRTTDTDVEIHCHGGQAAASAIIAPLVAAGCTQLDWQTWLPTTSPDRISTAAQIALAAATTTKAAAILLDQMQGALRRELEAVIHACDIGDCAQATARLEVLQSRERLGLHLTRPWRVVLAGRPNVGKSSLLNAILGYARAIVFDQPGTTRDVLSATTAIDGWPMEFSDTAGLRAACEQIEAEGIARARRVADAADLLVLVFDATQPWSPADEALLHSYPRSLVAVNKADQMQACIPTRPFLRTSCITSEGIAALLQEIAARLVSVKLLPGDAVPFSSALQFAIERAHQQLLAGQLTEAIHVLRAELLPADECAP